MDTPGNNNGEDPSNSAEVGTVTPSLTEQIPSITSTRAIPSTIIMSSTTSVPSMAQEGVVLSPR